MSGIFYACVSNSYNFKQSS